MGIHTPQTVRQSERIHVRLPISLRLASEKEQVSHPALTFNLSNGGVGIRAIVGLIAGQDVTVLADEGNRCSIPGRVAWVGPVGSSLEGLAGIEFLSPIGLSV